MAKLNIDIKTKDIPRLKVILEAKYASEDAPPDLSNDAKVLAMFEQHVQQVMKQMIYSFEYEKKKREQVIAVENIDLA